MQTHFELGDETFVLADYVASEARATPMDWDRGGAVHNWRNHVGEAVRAVWDTLTEEQKLAVAYDASARASAEEWD